MMTVHAFAPRCRNFVGHFYSYHLACQRAIEGLGGVYHTYIHEEPTFSSLPPNWHCWFSTLDKKRIFHKQAARLVREGGVGKRIFFIETFGRRDLRAFALSALRFGRGQDKIWILFRDDGIWKGWRDRQEIGLLINLLSIRFRENLQLLSDSQLIGDYFTERLRQRFTIVPIPNLDCPAHLFRIPSTRRLLFVGEPRKEKGRGVIERLARLPDPPSSFHLTCCETLALGPPTLFLSYHPTTLNDASYLRLLLQNDIILLPYCSTRYKRRTSGIFVEAICLGKVPLVSGGTWMSEELKRFKLEELIFDFEGPDFFNRIDEILRHSELEKKILAMQQFYHNFHTSTSFQKSVMELIKN